MTPEEHVLGVASAILNAEINGDRQTAGRYLQQISNDYGSAGVELAIRTWCDTLTIIQHQPAGLPDGTPVITRPVWLKPGTGERMDIENVTPWFRWAGQIVAARASMDQDTYNALLAALPDDPRERGRWVIAVAVACADTIGTHTQAMS
jgi:hypothetical protein